MAFGVDYDVETRTHAPRRALRGQDKHPTEKPLDLMLDLVSWFSDPGELVLDPCAGSGTTALACRLLGRSCLALERDEAWARRAASRAEGTLSDRDRVRGGSSGGWLALSKHLAETHGLPEEDVKAALRLGIEGVTELGTPQIGDPSPSSQRILQTLSRLLGVRSKEKARRKHWTSER